MKFLWPQLLYLLLVVPLLITGYVAILRRKKKLAVRFTSLALVKDAMGTSQYMKRHLPPLLFLLALILMIAAAARPVAVMTLPFRYQTIILAIDVSKSMQAEDVTPNRLSAAQAAVRKFVQAQPRHIRIGIVSYSGTASLVQQPTADREEILAAIDRLELQGRTAIGSGLLVSLKVLFPDLQFDLTTTDPRIKQKSSVPSGAGISLDEKMQARPSDFTPVPPGSYTSGAIILLTDGQNTAGPNPIEAARMAAERGVRVFTLGIGTSAGQLIDFNGASIQVRLDEEALKEIARMTHAEYFYADNAIDLEKIYQNLTFKMGFEKKETEMAPFLAAAAAFFFLLSAALSMVWLNRIG